MPTRTARTGWTGTLEQGVGKVELTSSKIGTYDVSFPKRAAEDAGGWTSPEELIAAAHSACYAMQLSALIGQAGGTPQALDVQADVSLGPDPAGGFRLTGIKLTVRGEVEGLNAEQFAQAPSRRKPEARHVVERLWEVREESVQLGFLEEALAYVVLLAELGGHPGRPSDLAPLEG